MLQQVRRFPVRDEQGRPFEVVELVAVVRCDDQTLADGVPTYFLATGCEAIPTSRSGEYHVPRKGITVRESSTA
jgi:hypothetical protein